MKYSMICFTFFSLFVFFLNLFFHNLYLTCDAKVRFIDLNVSYVMSLRLIKALNWSYKTVVCLLRANKVKYNSLAAYNLRIMKRNNTDAATHLITSISAYLEYSIFVVCSKAVPFFHLLRVMPLLFSSFFLWEMYTLPLGCVSQGPFSY